MLGYSLTNEPSEGTIPNGELRIIDCPFSQLLGSLLVRYLGLFLIILGGDAVSSVENGLWIIMFSKNR